MPKFPEPDPSNFTRFASDTVYLKPTVLLWRIYFASGPFSTQWNSLRFNGPTNSRFDHHPVGGPKLHKKYGVMYLAGQAFTCFAEVFQEHRVINTRRRDPWLVAMRLTRKVKILDLTGGWPTRNGASTAVHSGPKPRARRWASAIYQKWTDIEGLRYCSSMNANEPAIVLFERAQSALPTNPVFHRALADPTIRNVVLQAANEFGYLVV